MRHSCNWAYQASLTFCASVPGRARIRRALVAHMVSKSVLTVLMQEVTMKTCLRFLFAVASMLAVQSAMVQFPSGYIAEIHTISPP